MPLLYECSYCNKSARTLTSRLHLNTLKHFSCSAIILESTRRFYKAPDVATNSYPNYLVDNLNVQPSSFQELGVKESLCQALFREGITVPTEIQYEALPLSLTKRSDCIIQSETGSGKTLTFLLPALQDSSLGLSTLILVPTRELASQIHYQALKLAGRRKNCKRVLTMFTGYEEEEAQMMEYDRTRPHILIGTPKRILKMLEATEGEFIRLRRLVLDEVDKLLLPLGKRAPRKKRELRETRPRPVAAVMQKLMTVRRGQKAIQLICTSASANPALQEELEEIGWQSDIQFVSTNTPSTIGHTAKLTAPSSIQHRYALCDPTDRMVKMDKLVECFLANGEKSALVFIHKEASVTKFVEGINKRGVKAVPLYKQFLNHEDYSQFLAEFKSGKIQLAVGTEETVRGLDFTWLNTVYLTEVPTKALDYLHLCGRVGRVGREGKVVVLVAGDQELRRLLRHFSGLDIQGVPMEN